MNEEVSWYDFLFKIKAQSLSSSLINFEDLDVKKRKLKTKGIIGWIKLHKSWFPP